MRILDQHGVPLERKAAPVVTSGTAAPEGWFLELLGARTTSAGVNVSPASAMSVPAVKRAVDLIGSTIGVLPAKVFKVTSGDERTPATDHPAYGIVYRKSNAWTSARKFRETLTRDALLHGDGFAAVMRIDGKPVELIHLPPGTVTVELDERTREPVYSVTNAGSTDLVSWRDVLHVMAPTLDGYTGASPVRLGREAIGLSVTLETHAARLFANGARPGGVIRLPKAVGDDAAKRMKASWQSAFGGEGSGGTAVLEEDADFKTITLTSVDAQFLELRQHQVREIANVFGIPATMLNDLSTATYSNAEALGQAYRDETILPWVSAWEAAYERVLLTDEEEGTHLIALDTDALDRADLSAKSEAMAKRRAAGATTANEERRHLNLPAKPEGDVLGSPYTTANAAPSETPANV